MKDKIKFEFLDEERTMIVESLNLLRNYLTAQDRATESIDEIILKFENTCKVEFDKIELGITINALDNYRHKLKSMNQSRTMVNEVLLRLIDQDSKKKVFIRTLTRDNGRKH